MEEGQVNSAVKKPSDLHSDLEAQKLILSKLEDECKKNFLDDKSLNETLGQYKKAAHELKNSINHFLDSKSVNAKSVDGVNRPIDEELKEKIDMLEATLKSSGIIKDGHNATNGSTSQAAATGTDQVAGQNSDDQTKTSLRQSPPVCPKNDSQPQNQQTQNQPQPLTQVMPQSQLSDKKTSKSKKESNKKTAKSEPEPKIGPIQPESKPELDKNNVTADNPTNKETKDSESLSPERKPKTTLNKKSAHREKSTIDHILKNLNGENSEQNQLKLLCKMYIDLIQENRVLDKGMKQHVKTCARLNKEKEQLQSENNRLILAKSRLESLCRELQKHNKAIKEESLLRVKEDEDKHRTMAAKFQATLSEIMILVQESHQRNNTLREENMQYEKKLRIYLEHYDKWEKEIEKILASKDLEIQLTKTKLAEANLTSDHEREKFIEEKQQILNMVSDLHKKHSESVTNENHLKAQLSLYISKYDEFQAILAKSNEMFNGFKKDMEKMSKQIKDLERETIRWKKKCEESDKALAIANEARKTSNQKIQKLENLCRALQAERNQLSERLAKFQSTEKSENKKRSEKIESTEISDKPLDNIENINQSPICDNESTIISESESSQS